MGAEQGTTAALRLGLVGPVLPYRGGIAQHTTMLHRTLRTRVPLETVSFRRQYPAWLYPGRTDMEPGAAGLVEDGVRYLQTDRLFERQGSLLVLTGARSGAA
jgi:hypothetical protein